MVEGFGGVVRRGLEHPGQDDIAVGQNSTLCIAHTAVVSPYQYIPQSSRYASYRRFLRPSAGEALILNIGRYLGFGIKA